MAWLSQNSCALGMKPDDLKKMKLFDLYDDPCGHCWDPDLCVVDRQKLKRERAQYLQELSRPMGVYDVSKYTTFRAQHHSVEVTESHTELVEVALSYYNNNNNTAYSFECIEKVVMCLTGGITYFITFSAKNAQSIKEAVIFQAELWDAPGETVKVEYCGLKGTTRVMSLFEDQGFHQEYEH